MRYPFIKIPFASGGDKIAIPDATQPNGSISYQQGWGPDYEKEYGVAAGAKTVDRQHFNQVLNTATAVLNRWQTESFPEWITSVANGGAPYAYMQGTAVRYSPDGIQPYAVWLNTVDGNTASPSVANGWVQLVAVFSNPTETSRGAPLLATQAHAEAGTNNTAMVTALRVFQSIRSAAANASELLRGVVRIATQAETTAGVLDNVAITPKKLRAGFSMSLTANGYFAFPTWMGGFIFQWGTAATTAGGIASLVLPMTFPTAALGRVATYTTAGVPGNAAMSVGAATTASVTGYISNTAGTPLSGAIISFLVWGY